MTRHIGGILLATIVLSACQSTLPAPQQAALSSDEIGRLKIDRDAGRISYSEWAQRTGAAARASMRLSPPEEAAIQHRLELAHRVDAGLLTPEQFEAESALTLERVKAAQASGSAGQPRRSP